MSRIAGWVLLILLLISCQKSSNSIENLLIKGSDTEVNVALALAEAFMEKEPNVSIAVTGGGSGTGVAALLSGKTNIANSSRPMKPDELKMAEARGIRPLPIVFGIDALAIIVNEQNPLDSLTMDELARVFKGEVRHWAAIGGPNMNVSLYGRQSNSGTFIYFRDEVLNAEYSASLKQMNGTAQIVEAISTDPAGVGYVGVGYLLEKSGDLPQGVKLLKVSRAKGQTAYSPLESSHITSDQYPIVRPLYQYVNGKPSGRLLEFLLFAIGAEGQAIVSKNGYYPISKAQHAADIELLNAEVAINK
ncbi:MAG: PstS family phosphate ABC transporter substrate-binding protein [Saprospiraceae bacterium]|nr:PstS family phosphate ABC transporter substrate-binding protein [Saprospiraceae bacterium]